MRRAVALLAPALARRSAAPASRSLAQPPCVPGASYCPACSAARRADAHAGGWLRFGAAAKPAEPQRRGVRDGACPARPQRAPLPTSPFLLADWFNKPSLSVQQIHDEIFRRWSVSPTPSALP